MELGQCLFYLYRCRFSFRYFNENRRGRIESRPDGRHISARRQSETAAAFVFSMEGRLYLAGCCHATRFLSKTRGCRLALRYVPFRVAKRHVWPYETCRFARRNGAFCNPTDCQWVMVAVLMDVRVAKNKVLLRSVCRGGMLRHGRQARRLWWLGGCPWLCLEGVEQADDGAHLALFERLVAWDAQLAVVN